MKVFLDNCVDRNLARGIVGHEVGTAAEMGWGDLSNGVLLAKVAERFDVFVTVDKNLRYQQNLAKLPVPVVEVDAVNSRIDELRKFLPAIQRAIEQAAHYRFVGIKADGTMELLVPRSSEHPPR